MFLFFFKQRTADERRISDWRSDVCSSDLPALWAAAEEEQDARRIEDPFVSSLSAAVGEQNGKISAEAVWAILNVPAGRRTQDDNACVGDAMRELGFARKKLRFGGPPERSEEHKSELQSLMRISHAVFCLKKTNRHYHLLN